MEQVSTEIGLIPTRHERHTGSREIFSKGLPQRRQSDGNSAANRLWATTTAPETTEFQRACPAGTAWRVVSPVLLKT